MRKPKWSLSRTGFQWESNSDWQWGSDSRGWRGYPGGSVPVEMLAGDAKLQWQRRWVRLVLCEVWHTLLPRRFREDRRRRKGGGRRRGPHCLLACHTLLHCCAHSAWGCLHVWTIYRVKVFPLNELFIILSYQKSAHANSSSNTEEKNTCLHPSQSIKPLIMEKKCCLLHSSVLNCIASFCAMSLMWLTVS